jgi:hypothetical protein
LPQRRTRSAHPPRRPPSPAVDSSPGVASGSTALTICDPARTKRDQGRALVFPLRREPKRLTEIFLMQAHRRAIWFSHPVVAPHDETRLGPNPTVRNLRHVKPHEFGQRQAEELIRSQPRKPIRLRLDDMGARRMAKGERDL